MNSECHCGTATHAPHETGTCGCQRFITPAPIPAGIDPILQCPMWEIPGQNGRITDFTLRQQRGYHQHPDGQWSRWEGSENSLDA